MWLMPAIAHISDLHLLSLEQFNPTYLLGKRITGAVNLLLNRGGEYPVEVARAAMRDINAQGVDHVVVTGDLTNLALPAEFRLAREVLEGLELPRSQVTVVPGNHDCYTRGVERREQFERTLQPFVRGAIQPGPGYYPRLSLHDGLAVVALSSARASAPLMAVGTLGSRQLRQAETLLGSEGCAGAFRVVALHHPPLCTHTHWHSQLTDHRALAAMLARVGADLVVHGHIHRFSREYLPGPGGSQVPVVAVPSGTWLAPKDPERRAQYHIYQVEQGQLRGVVVRRWEPQQRCFDQLRVMDPE